MKGQDFENSTITIHKRSQKSDFAFYAKYLSQIDVKLMISDVKRNAEGLITSINIRLLDTKNNQKIDTKGTVFENGKGISNISVGRKNGILFLKAE